MKYIARYDQSDEGPNMRGSNLQKMLPTFNTYFSVVTPQDFMLEFNAHFFFNNSFNPFASNGVERGKTYDPLNCFGHCELSFQPIRHKFCKQTTKMVKNWLQFILIGRLLSVMMIDHPQARKMHLLYKVNAFLAIFWLINTMFLGAINRLR